MNLEAGDINRVPFAPLPVQALYLGRSAAAFFPPSLALPELDMH
jgi:hypothetical protein